MYKGTVVEHTLSRSSDRETLAAITAAWSLREPVSVVPATSGTQNQTWRVVSGSGSFFLRVYRNTDDVRRVRYEHAVLKRLAARPLSFRVAAPIPVGSGETFVSVGDALAALFPALEGDSVDRSNPAHARACGVALGELHAALREIDVGLSEWFRYGDLEHIHPRVPEPWALPRELALEEASRRRLAAVLDRVRERIPEWYATLPQQLCHNDFSPGNLLMRGDSVGAVLDFEFVAPDVRAIDLCTCWYWLALRGWNGSGEMDEAAVQAVLDGYAAEAVPLLTVEELHAMPDLVLLRGFVSIIHREGRRRAGLDSEQAVLDRVALLLALDDWLRDGGVVTRWSPE